MFADSDWKVPWRIEQFLHRMYTLVSCLLASSALDLPLLTNTQSPKHSMHLATFGLFHHCFGITVVFY